MAEHRIAPLENRYVRTREGRMIHRVGCSKLIRSTKARPWNWAEGMDPEDICDQLWRVGIAGYLWCSKCCPDVRR